MAKIESDQILPISAVEFDPQNARKRTERSAAMIKQSLQQFGPLRSLVGQKLPDGRIIVRAGNGTLEEAGKIGVDKIRIVERRPDELIVVVADDLDENQWKSYAIADNRTSDLSEWDEAILEELAQDVSLDDWFTAEEMEGWDVDFADIQSLDPVEPLTDEDAVPEDVETRCKKGDIWQLGRHRLMCGDSTVISDVDRLMDGKKADMVFTDPPYGISIVNTKSKTVGGGGETKFGKVGGKNWGAAKTYAEIENDDTTDCAREFYYTCQSAGMQNFIIWGGNYFTDFLSPSACWIVWDKQNTGNFADVELAWTSFGKAAKLYSFMWNGLARAGDRKTELSSRVHPTQKPVGLFVEIFQDFEFSSCYDGFLGSGSTLIACEKTGRTCYGMELSEKYCDVILKRWEDYTGNTAVRIEK